MSTSVLSRRISPNWLQKTLTIFVQELLPSLPGAQAGQQHNMDQLKREQQG
jgi:hypothetical protein